ncbi:cytochrome c [Marinobacter sp. SS8-8]|uniref:c-type cytochrome n=1 Tax=Marinobacter sp. SS8-8 TaxID=3050452 RepID=UPI002599A3A8|nr:cytochrome c [Marinobacter sp. SS8-8]|tara:strand:- start:1168 stop:1482 length:315 start_codon:yes stop_codon:yes gene_type:complete
MKLLNRNLISNAVLVAALVVGGAGSAAAQDADDPMAFIRGAQSWADNCSRCHNMRDPAELRDDVWEPSVIHMRIRAGLTGQEVRDITAFLQKSNDPADNKGGDK